ncbi:polyhydroxybutyrate depolymerase [Streptomyces sp. B3I7]|uniref:alpha/beta hydrolase family esterase n=1 Tax=unclassified Streptomyces TaxID=2593676 RepID=UPI0027841C8E|nr:MULTISPECIES: PHB depolymerase family esterase [unclassified Streptomyces]MDQ0791440.1 polyhydroxybutyrate depolymerase [Streptomyces sp. B3I8]MDQ0808837.1 polyhydroxybutyrate depolymerase [Streptomyces sp. B3I7]
MNPNSVDVDGRPRTYTVVGPADGKPSRALVLVFHGSSQTGRKHRAFTGAAYDALADTNEAVVVYLDGHKGNWNDARRGSSFPARTENIDDVAFARSVVGKLAESHRIDTHRVFAVGYSNGGQMVMRLMHEAPELLAGAAVIAATLPAPENFLAADLSPAPMPVALIHGTKDRIVPYAGGEMAWWTRKLFKVGGRGLSAPRTAAYFARHNGIATEPVSTTVPHRAGSADGTSVERTAYEQQDRPPVVLYTVHGGGHTVPGPKKAPAVLGRTSQDLDVAELVGEFFGTGR